MNDTTDCWQFRSSKDGVSLIDRECKKLRAVISIPGYVTSQIKNCQSVRESSQPKSHAVTACQRLGRDLQFDVEQDQTEMLCVSIGLYGYVALTCKM
jgi:hypothetical protein